MNRLNAAICGHFINAMSFVMLMAGGLSNVPKWITLAGVVCIVLAVTIAHLVESEASDAPWIEEREHYRRVMRWYIVCATLSAAAVLLGLFSLWSL